MVDAAPPPPPPMFVDRQQQQQSVLPMPIVRDDFEMKLNGGGTIRVGKGVCRFWAQGQPCRYGDRCKFRHDNGEPMFGGMLMGGGASSLPNMGMGTMSSLGGTMGMMNSSGVHSMGSMGNMGSMSTGSTGMSSVASRGMDRGMGMGSMANTASSYSPSMFGAAGPAVGALPEYLDMRKAQLLLQSQPRQQHESHPHHQHEHQRFFDRSGGGGGLDVNLGVDADDKESGLDRHPISESSTSPEDSLGSKSSSLEDDFEPSLALGNSLSSLALSDNPFSAPFANARDSGRSSPTSLSGMPYTKSAPMALFNHSSASGLSISVGSTSPFASPVQDSISPEGFVDGPSPSLRSFVPGATSSSYSHMRANAALVAAPLPHHLPVQQTAAPALGQSPLVINPNTNHSQRCDKCHSPGTVYSRSNVHLCWRCCPCVHCGSGQGTAVCAVGLCAACWSPIVGERLR